jgi:predicted TIM-barrel fold metal-dependent hydrolase
MKIFDFNIHLYSKEFGDINSQILEDTELTSLDLITSLNKNIRHFVTSGLTSGNFMLFNSEIHKDPNFNLFITESQKYLPNSCYTILLDLDTKFEELEFIKQLGISFIKFHCYVQKITSRDYKKILFLCKKAEELNLGICIDTSFGTTGLYKYDNLRLVAFLSEHIKKSVIILLHSGGARILEAMLIADQNPNIYLETSLTIDFYRGSNLQNDIMFAYKKIGFNRVLFASDFPYQAVNGALNDVLCLADKFNLSSEDLENILYNNSYRLLNG